jgi:hypothetical protein
MFPKWFITLAALASDTMNGRSLKVVTLLAAVLAVASQALSIATDSTGATLLFIGLSMVFILVGLSSMSLEVLQSFYSTATQQDVTIKLFSEGHQE